MLSTYIWEKSHEAGALYSESKLALVLFGNVSSASTEDSTMRIEELLEKFCVLVVYVMYAILFEIALCFCCHDNTK